MRQQTLERELELYIHIPFCVRKCAYCDFLSGPADRETQEAYVQALEKEIDSVEEGKDRPVISVFVGGGTPSVLEAELIGRIFEKLHKKFQITPDAEITIEANPGTFNSHGNQTGDEGNLLSSEKFTVYRQAGINRLSLGLQSPNDRELKILGRIHTFEDFRQSYLMAREVGFANINVDLMCAIPEQTYEGWMDNLRRIAELGPEHISAYSLIVEEGTPFASRKLILPDEDTEYRMYEDTAPLLEKYGYHQYEISNYAREGRECLHNRGYWERTDYLGLGLGAASLIGNKRFSNTGNMQEYLAKSSHPDQIRQEVQELTMQDAMGEFMFLGLRMTEGISREDFTACFGCRIEDIYGQVLKKHRDLGLLEEQSGRIYLTRKGIHVSNAVMADFLL
jgi:oxygen-independent coproporphyrinogen-3 oxidase